MNHTTTTLPGRQKGILYYLPVFFMLLGIVLRLTIFFQNRNLIIDEANIVRNLDERGFMELLQPLRYEQFAPPVFLWFEKLFALLLGYGEKSMRLYALLCGIGSLLITHRITRKVLPPLVAWLPLALVACAPILVKYCAEVKQYVPDSMVALALILLALRTDIFKTRTIRFVLLWMLAGSIAIWTSQPSVFTLAGVGAYYFYLLAQQKQWRLLRPLLAIGAVWLLQFGLYFEVILKAQINSAYLQNYHRDYFLYALPKSFQEAQHNWARLKELLSNTGGQSTVSHFLTGIVWVIGFCWMFLRHRARFMLIALPVALTLLAAALHQFSLIDRVAIFLLPLCMIIVGYGYAALLQLPGKAVRIIVPVLAFFNVVLHNYVNILWEKLEFHELTAGFDYIISKGGTGKELYVNCASGPTYIYYTKLHPDNHKWDALKGARVYDWSEDEKYIESAQQMPTDTAYFIFTGGDEGLRNRHLEEIKIYMDPVDTFQHATCWVYTYVKKSHPVQVN
jgi:4-amino-4-deoxy-L-arabinose transferase-like glycosyltransferase